MGEAEARERLVQLQVALPDGCVFVVQDDERVVAAVTVAEPTVGLVFYDLKTCLRHVAGEEPDTEAEGACRIAEGRGCRWKGKAIGALCRGGLRGRRRSLAALAPPPGAGRPLLRRRVDGDVRARLHRGATGSSRSRRRSSPPRAVPPASGRRGAARRDSQARVPRGGLPAALGPPVAVLPRQVPLRDPARPARSPRRAARGGRPRRGSGRGSPCRARARRRCSRRVGVARVRASLPHRPQGRRSSTRPSSGSRASSSRASVSASSRTS